MMTTTLVLATFTLGLHAGALLRGGDGYAEHASAFGFDDAGAAAALGLSAGVYVAPRLRLVATADVAFSISYRSYDPEETLDVTNHLYLLEAGYTAWRTGFDVMGTPAFIGIELTAGGGLYDVSDEVGGRSHRERGPGATAGANLFVGSGSWNLRFGYRYHLTAVALEDRLGGELTAGGQQLAFEVGLRL